MEQSPKYYIVEAAALPEAAAPEAPKATAPQTEKRHPHFGRKGKASAPDEQETTEERETVGSGKP